MKKLRVLVLGGAGFVGSHIVSELQRRGHEVVLGGRGPGVDIQVDYEKDTQSEIWLPRLKDIDGAVNAVGILHGSKKLLEAVHFETPQALFQACFQSSHIQQIIQISAKGSEPDCEKTQGILYSDTKRAAEKALKNLIALNPLRSATIIRPSFIFSKGSYGGGSLFRALAAFPKILPVVGKGDQLFQPIAAEDLAQIVCTCLENPKQGLRALEGVGPEIVTIQELLEKTRKWLGFKSGRVIHMPLCWVKVLSLLGSWIPGFSSVPLNQTSYELMQIPGLAVGSPGSYEKIIQETGVRPQGLSEFLESHPSFVQDRWHARLYWIKPLIQWVLALLWIVSGLWGFVLPDSMTQDIKNMLPFSEIIWIGIQYFSGSLDILIGLWILTGWKTLWVGWLQMAVIVGYTLFISLWLPHFWLDPFGGVIKNFPILVLILVQMALASDR